MQKKEGKKEEVKKAPAKKKAPVKKAAPKKKVEPKPKAEVKPEVKVEAPKVLKHRGVEIKHVVDLVLEGRDIKQIQLANGEIRRLPLEEFNAHVKEA